MLRQLLITVVLIIPTVAFSDPIVFICERPAWGDKSGCGPNNTHSTYAFHVETNDFRLKNPDYTFQLRHGCEVEKARRIRFHYRVIDNEIHFRYQRPLGNTAGWSTIRLDRDTLVAEMVGVSNGPILKCRQEESESWIINNPTFR